MVSPKERLVNVLTRLEEAVKSLSQTEEYSYVKLNPHPPATSGEIKKYEEFLELKLPPSYRAFLELHNGYDNLVHPGSMLSIQSVMPGGGKYQKIREWKQMCADYGAGEVLDGVVIAYLNQPNNWAYLDPNRLSGDGEFVLVQWLSGDIMEFPTLADFFEYSIAVCEDAKAGPPS